jgi:predicted DNA-binding transcriptional regulator AlpA
MRVRSIRNRVAEGEQGVVAKAPTMFPKVALTEQEAAQYIGMSAAWLKKSRTQRFREMIDAPPFIRAGAKRIVYRREDLEKWQNRHLEQVGPIRVNGSEEGKLSEEPNPDAPRRLDRVQSYAGAGMQSIGESSEFA